MVGWVRKHELLSYFLLAFVFSWAFGVPLALSVAGVIGPLPLWLHYLTAYGPFISALVVTFIISGGKGLKAFIQNIFKWKLRFGWLILAFSPVLIFGIINLFLSGTFLNFNLLGQINFLPNLGVLALILWIFNSGLGEEAGWRGFALPRLQKKMSPLSASLFLSLPWVLWHLPAFFYLPNYMQMGFTIFPFFAMGVAAGSIIYTWLYNSSKGNVLLAVLFHGAFNFVTASKAGEGVPAAVLSMLVILGAIIIVALTRKKLAWDHNG